MAWEAQMVEMVRILINDVSTTPTYSDSRLERALMVSAYQILQEVGLETTYTVNILTQEVTPDPVDNLDYNFCNLWALKTVCFIFGSEYKTQSLNSISVKNGPSSIDLKGRSDGFKFMYEKACSDYDEYKMNYIAGNVGKAILTPYSPGADSIGSSPSARGGYFR